MESTMSTDEKVKSQTEEMREKEYEWILKRLRSLDLKTRKEMLKNKENNDGDSETLALDRRKELLDISEESDENKKLEEQDEKPSASDQKTKDSNSNTKCNKKHIPEPHLKNKIEGKQKKTTNPSFLKKTSFKYIDPLIAGYLGSGCI